MDENMAITVLRILQDWLYLCGMNGGTKIQREAIDMAIKALEQPKPNWIPLSEKFPQEYEDVLLQFPSNQGVGYYEDGDWMINTGEGICSMICYDEEKPIAWMPRPEPYKAEGSNE